MLKYALSMAALFLIAGTVEAGNRCGCRAGYAGGWTPQSAYATAAPVTAPAVAQTNSGYRSYSYEPGTAATQPVYNVPAPNYYYGNPARNGQFDRTMNWRTTPSYTHGIR